MSQKIPVKAYHQENRHVPKDSAIRRMVFPERACKYDNTAADANANIIYVWYDAAVEYAEKCRENALFVSRPHIPGDGHCRTCGKYYAYYFEDRLRPGHVLPANVGRCCLSSVKGRPAKPGNSCDKYIPRT